jgi:putative addiction module component (TIGR02574 family)
MSDLACMLFEEAMQLSEKDREDLAARLFDTIGPESEEEVAASWEAEIRQRLEDLNQGRVKTVPADEFQRRVLKALNAIPRD